MARTEGEDAAFRLVFDRDVYWYPPRPGYFSLDGRTWHRFRDLFRGSMSISLARSKKRGPHARFAVRAEER